jgi:hypothetical protein
MLRVARVTIDKSQEKVSLKHQRKVFNFPHLYSSNFFSVKCFKQKSYPLELKSNLHFLEKLFLVYYREDSTFKISHWVIILIENISIIRKLLKTF